MFVKIQDIAEKIAWRQITNDVLCRIEREVALTDILAEVFENDVLTYEIYQKLAYLEIPLVKILSQYKGIEFAAAFDLIKKEYITFENLIDILHFWFSSDR